MDTLDLKEKFLKAKLPNAAADVLAKELAVIDRKKYSNTFTKEDGANLHLKIVLWMGAMQVGSILFLLKMMGKY